MTTTLHRLAALALPAVRPYLRVHLALLGRQVARTPLPQDAPVLQVEGPRPTRLLVVGELAASGLGVLLHGMAFPAQVGREWGRVTGRGCSWRTVAGLLLSAGQAASHPELEEAATRADAAVVALGIPDVLLATRGGDFEAHVEELVVAIRSRASDSCPVVLAGLPPMSRFQPMPPLAARLLALRARRLDDAMGRVADRHEGVSFVPFPVQRLAGLYVRDRFSYRALHRIWAHAVVTALTALTATSPSGPVPPSPREQEAPAPPSPTDPPQQAPTPGAGGTRSSLLV